MHLKARTLKVAHLSVGRALIVLTVPQHVTLPEAKQNTPKGLGKCYVWPFLIHSDVCVCVCVCWLLAMGHKYKFKGEWPSEVRLCWQYFLVNVCRHWGLITNNSCLTFSQVYKWNAGDVCKATGRTVGGRSMSHHLQPVSNWVCTIFKRYYGS